MTLTDKSGHLAWCALVALALARQDGGVLSPTQENLFCQIDTDSLNVHNGRSAQVVTIYRPTVAQDIGGDHSINKADH